MSVSVEVQRIAQDIKEMKIRGAGEIARTAARALLKAAEGSKAKDVGSLVEDLEASSRLLLETRPTAVSLPNSVKYVMVRVHQALSTTSDMEEVRSAAIKTAQDFIENSEKAVQRIGEIGARSIQDRDVLLTHCNSSAVTTIIKTAWSQRKRIEVFVTETRPRFQGLITVKELTKAGIPVTLIVDSAARFFMPKINKVFVGADAVTANGAVVNKIGTSLIALAAYEARVQFFVAAETYKFSPETMIGDVVPIEERDPNEIVSRAELEKIPRGLTVRNPSFDVTPAKYIDLIITEKGIIPPQGAILLIREAFGAIKPEELAGYSTPGLSEDS